MDRLFALLEQEYKWAAKYYMPVYLKAIHWANKLLKCSYLWWTYLQNDLGCRLNLEFWVSWHSGALPGSLLLSLFPTSLSTPGEVLLARVFHPKSTLLVLRKKEQWGWWGVPRAEAPELGSSIVFHCISTDHLCSEGCALGTWLSLSFCNNLEKIMPRILFCCVVDFFFFMP